MPDSTDNRLDFCLLLIILSLDGWTPVLQAYLEIYRQYPANDHTAEHLMQTVFARMLTHIARARQTPLSPLPATTTVLHALLDDVERLNDAQGALCDGMLAWAKRERERGALSAVDPLNGVVAARFYTLDGIVGCVVARREMFGRVNDCVFAFREAVPLPYDDGSETDLSVSDLSESDLSGSDSSDGESPVRWVFEHSSCPSDAAEEDF